MAFVELCFEKYANVNKNALKKHTTSRWRLRSAFPGRKDEEREKSEITKQMRKGEAVAVAGLRHHLPEIMKHSKTYKRSHYFPRLNLFTAHTANDANELWFLLTLTTGDKFSIQRRPSAWRTDRSLALYRPLLRQQWKCGQELWTELYSVSVWWTSCLR